MKKTTVLLIIIVASAFFNVDSVQARGCNWWLPTAIIGGAAVITTAIDAVVGPPVYYQPAPVYYHPAPVYYAEPIHPSSTVVIVEGGNYGYGDYHHNSYCRNHGYNGIRGDYNGYRVNGGGNHSNAWQPQFGGGGHR